MLVGSFISFRQSCFLLLVVFILSSAAAVCRFISIVQMWEWCGHSILSMRHIWARISTSSYASIVIPWPWWWFWFSCLKWKMYFSFNVDSSALKLHNLKTWSDVYRNISLTLKWFLFGDKRAFIRLYCNSVRQYELQMYINWEGTWEPSAPYPFSNALQESPWINGENSVRAF